MWKAAAKKLRERHGILGWQRFPAQLTPVMGSVPPSSSYTPGAKGSRELQVVLGVVVGNGGGGEEEAVSICPSYGIRDAALG